jgi:twinkle protein
MDGDEPGRVAEKELARRIGPEKCWRIQYPDGCKDANDVLKKIHEFEVIKLLDNAKPFPVEGIVKPEDLERELIHLYEHGAESGYKTGWAMMDRRYTVKMCEMSIVTGIPGSGKSNWLDALIVNLIKQYGMKFAIFSPENWPLERHLQNLIEKLARKPFHRDAIDGTKRITKSEITESMNRLNSHVQFIMPKEDIISVDVILEKAKVAIFRDGVQGIAIDPWNEIEHLYGNLREDQYLSKQLTKIRRFARHNGVHVWVVAHPKNQTKEPNGTFKPPTMYDISGGAHWHNKADNGICVHREDKKTDKCFVFVQKIRFRETGKVGDVKFVYCRDTGVYSEEGIDCYLNDNNEEGN